MHLNMQLVLFYFSGIKIINLMLWGMTLILLIKLKGIILFTIRNCLPLYEAYCIENMCFNLPPSLLKSTLITITSVTTDSLTTLYDVLLAI